MEVSDALLSLVSPPVLFFALGALAGLVRSDLEIPQPVTKAMSLYLLMAIGFKGGVELGHATWSGSIAVTLAAAVAMAVLVPFYTYPVLRWRLPVPDAGAMAATYGSVSAVTFITAVAFLTARQIGYGGHMVAALALMELPAVIVGIFLIRRATAGSGGSSTSEIVRHAVLNGAVFLLLGSLAIGMVTNDDGAKSLAPFTDAIFKGVLCLFLLELGMVAARRLPDVRRAGAFLAGFAVATPLVNATLAIVVAKLAGIPQGDAILLTVLVASASYIAVPAAMRVAVPDADPAIYVSASLGVTFPFNVVIGIPMYSAVITALWR